MIFDIKIGTGTAPLSFVMVHVSQVSSAILMLCKRDTTSSYHSRYACAYAKDGEGQGLVKHTQSPRQTIGVEKGKYMTCNLGYLTRQLIEALCGTRDVPGVGTCGPAPPCCGLSLPIGRGIRLSREGLGFFFPPLPPLPPLLPPLPPAPPPSSSLGTAVTSFAGCSIVATPGRLLPVPALFTAFGFSTTRTTHFSVDFFSEDSPILKRVFLTWAPIMPQIVF